MRTLLATLLLTVGLTMPVLAAEPENALGIRVPGSLEEMFGTVYEDPDAGFSFRGGYSAYVFQGMREYDSLELGYSLGYAAPNGTDVSVYVYDLGVADIPDGRESALVMKELATAEQGIAGSGRYIRVERLLEPELLSPHFAQYSHLLTTDAGQAIRSHTLVRGLNGRFVKVRATGTSSALESRLAVFLEQLSSGLGVTAEAE